MTSEVIYTGKLRTRCTHVRSGNELINDAPTDNNGRGEAFSPTDTVATALASCMLTVMGIKARTLDVEAELKGATAAVTKIMASGPRRITRIDVALKLPARISKKNQKILEHTANTCPVIYSIHPDIEKHITFNWIL